LSRDKISVDEPLISTDVDSLIRTIAEKGTLSLNDLRAVSKIDKKTLDKWITVLEDEDYIKVEYGLRGTFIHWIGQEPVLKASEQAPEPPEPIAAKSMEGEPQITPEPQEETFTITDVQSEEGAEDFSAQVPVEEEPEPEELLSEYLARRRGVPVKTGNLKSNILTNLESEEVEPAPESMEAEPSEPQRPVMASIPASDVRELVSSYMKEINQEKANISSLRKEREALYHDKFASMEGKMHADIVVLTEKVLEKQEKIAQLKERVLELPDKVDQLSKLQEQMESLKSEGRDALSRTKSKAEQFISGVKESKDEVEEKIGSIESEIDAQSSKLQELEKLGGSLEARSEKLKASLGSAKAQVDEITSAMDSLLSDLEKVHDMKSEIDSMTDSVKEIVASHGDELESLEGELDGIAKIENWVQDYIRDYEDKIDSIEQYVGKSDDELADLKEAAESLYMKKFLGQLEDVSDAYSTELHEAVETERSIEEKMAASKARITDLVKESQQMIKRLKQETSGADEKDFHILVARVKARTERAKKSVTDKESERMKIREESSKTRKTKAPNGSKAKKMSKVVPRKRK
jgi:chromosome segregation ATPase